MKTFAKWLFPLCGALLAMGAQAQRRTLIFDNDGSELLLNTYWNEQPLTLWQLDSLVDIQRDTQVGTYAICAGSDFFYYRSQYGRLYGDDLDGQIAHGGNEALYRTLKKKLRQCRKTGKRRHRSDTGHAHTGPEKRHANHAHPKNERFAFHRHGHRLSCGLQRMVGGTP